MYRRTTLLISAALACVCLAVQFGPSFKPAGERREATLGFPYSENDECLCRKGLVPVVDAVATIKQDIAEGKVEIVRVTELTKRRNAGSHFAVGDLFRFCAVRGVQIEYTPCLQ